MKWMSYGSSLKNERKTIHDRRKTMRLDKFLKVSRVIKRRTLAKEVCDKGRVSVNGQIAKAGTNVKEGDEIVIRFGQKIVTIRADAIKDTTRKEEASSMYTVVSEEFIKEENDLGI